METFLTYLQVFAVGGLVCLIGQVLINYTKLTSARILVIFLVLGIILESVMLFEPIKKFAHAGITIPITGFGSNLAKGAIKGVEKDGLLGAITGGVQASGAGLGAAILIGFIVALIAKPHTK